MSTPDNTDTQTTEPSYEERVNVLVGEMHTDGWQAPEGIDPGLLYAANAEKRRRDTQSQFTKQQQQLKAAETRATKLAEKLESTIMESLPLKQQSRLEELKATDPDSWREELTKLEASAKGELAKELDTINKAASQVSEEDHRLAVLAQFQEANPDITPEMIDEDVPPRITKKLANGTITFEQFLEESAKFLRAGKVIDGGEEAPSFVDLGKAAGGSRPGENDQNKAIVDSYAKEVY
jgi:hypothetical protein